VRIKTNYKDQSDLISWWKDMHMYG